MKHYFHLALLLLTLFFWKGFVDSGKDLAALNQQLEEVRDTNDFDREDELKEEIVGAEGQRVLMGLLLTIFSCAVGGIFVWVYLLPAIAQRATHAIFDSGEKVEEDPLREAHSLIGIGDYEGAVVAFRKVAYQDPTNRLPWVEMAKVHREHLEDPDSAIQCLREGLEAHEWEEDDAAFLLFRLAEVYHEDLQDGPSARAMMQQVIDTFPDSRHSANATHKLHEWDREDEEKAMMDRLHGQGPGGNTPL